MDSALLLGALVESSNPTGGWGRLLVDEGFPSRAIMAQAPGSAPPADEGSPVEWKGMSVSFILASAIDLADAVSDAHEFETIRADVLAVALIADRRSNANKAFPIRPEVGTVNLVRTIGCRAQQLLTSDQVP